MGMMDGKRGLVVGIANDRSFAYSIAESLIREGAECLFTHFPGDKMARRCEKAVSTLGVEDPWLCPLDASSDEDLDAVFDRIGSEFGKIDFLVHSIVFADREWLQEGKFTKTPREVYTQAMDISA
jgi:enoyl-[acyl-carrier protein] reductase I